MRVNIKKKRESGSQVYYVSGEATIYSAGELQTSLLDIAQDPGDKKLDLSGVEKMDTAGFQLLYLLHKEMESSGASLDFINPSDEVKKYFNVYGQMYQ
jgi:anti-anti-sigma factor